VVGLSPSTALGVAFGLGLVAGLRTFTPPMAVAWAAFVGRLDLQGPPFAFMASAAAAIAFTGCALAEYVYDVLPRTPPRTRAGPLVARAVSGAWCGACVCAAAGAAWPLGAAAGGAAGIAGAFLGLQARLRLAGALRGRDAIAGIAESVLAILAAGAFVAT
jgi:uncharacterized membrane protein